MKHDYLLWWVWIVGLCLVGLLVIGGIVWVIDDGPSTGTVRNDVRLYQMPDGRDVACIGWGDRNSSSSAISCDWQNPTGVPK